MFMQWKRTHSIITSLHSLVIKYFFLYLCWAPTRRENLDVFKDNLLVSLGQLGEEGAKSWKAPPYSPGEPSEKLVPFPPQE